MTQNEVLDPARRRQTKLSPQRRLRPHRADETPHLLRGQHEDAVLAALQRQHPAGHRLDEPCVVERTIAAGGGLERLETEPEIGGQRPVIGVFADDIMGDQDAVGIETEGLRASGCSGQQSRG